MESKSIKYKGISRIPSDNDSFDGEMEELYNLVNFNGELRPVVQPDSIQVASGTTLLGNLLFVHKNEGFEHFITFDGSTLRSYDYIDSELKNRITLTSFTTETLIDIKSVGNTLIVLTDKDIHYFLWKRDNLNYKYLGTEIPFPVINFDQQSVSTFSDGSTIDKIWSVTFSDYAVNIAKIVNWQGYDFPSWGADRMKELYETLAQTDMEFENAVKGPLHAFLEKLSKEGLHVYPFFIRYALRMYDGSLIKHSMPLLILPSKFMAFQVGIINPSTDNKIGYQFERISKLVYSHPIINDLNNYRDLVQSIDVFMSEPIYTYIYDGHFNGVYGTDYWNSDPDSPDKLFGGITKSREDILNEISSVGNFYYIYSISIDDLQTAASNKEIKVENLNALANRETMVDDYLSHDKLIAGNGYTYNNKLHLSGVRRKPFLGFKLEGLRSYYYNTDNEANHNVGNRAFVFYPGNSKKLLLSGGSSGAYREKFIWLKEHSRLNGNYYLDPNLDNINVNDVNSTSTTIFDVEVAFGRQSSVIVEPNKLFVSAFQNPFHFPVESRITLPVSNIIAMASNTEAISQGQFGQFPLFVFTDDGIWALEVNQEGKYMARQPVSREVAINRNILQMDNTLAFITAKGITILNGSQTECISDIIKDNNTRASKLNLTSFINAVIPENERTEMQNIYQTADIEQFLKDANLAYEYINGTGRVYAINEGYKYAYVFDILSKTWSKVKSDYKRAVNNYPDAYVQSTDGTIKILSSLGQSQENIRVMFITRPIKLENVLFSLQWINHKGILNNTLNTVIYGSRDGINYQPIKSGTKRLLRLTGSPYRFFKIAVIASLNPKDVLSGIDISLEPRYTNRLR